MRWGNGGKWGAKTEGWEQKWRCMPELTHEIVNDIPVLMHVIKDRLGMMTAMDSVVKRHGNRLGISLGEVMGTWLTHILRRAQPFHESCARVGDGAPKRAWSYYCGHEVLDGDLAEVTSRQEVLDEMSMTSTWHSVERRVNQNMIQAYKLKVKRVGWTRRR